MRGLIIGLAVVVCVSSAHAQQRDTRRFHIIGTSALSCLDPNALLALSEVDARQKWGDINYMRIANDGRCADVSNSRPLMICHSTQRVSFMAQLFNGTAGRCYAMLTSALADDSGSHPQPGISN